MKRTHVVLEDGLLASSLLGPRLLLLVALRNQLGLRHLESFDELGTLLLLHFDTSLE